MNLERIKYIKTSNGEIIFFPAIIEHGQFKSFNPISAGYCSIKNEVVHCYGDSHSLKLESNTKEDSLEATKQIFGIDAMIKLSNFIINN